MRAKRGEAQQLVHRLASLGGASCIEWPYAVNAKGYGIVFYDGASSIASNVVCKLAHGPAPVGKTEVAHSCGNRRCCNPEHLRHATSSENKADMVIHGTKREGSKHSQAKLTAADVAEIRSSKERQSVLARRFGVTDKAIHLVRARINWASV